MGSPGKRSLVTLCVLSGSDSEVQSSQKGSLCFLAESWRGTRAPEGGGLGRPLPLRRSHFQMFSLAASSSSLLSVPGKKDEPPAGKRNPHSTCFALCYLVLYPQSSLGDFCEMSNQ